MPDGEHVTRSKQRPHREARSSHSIFRAIRFRTIRARLLVFFVLIVLLTAGVISATSVAMNLKSGQDQATAQLESVATLKDAEIKTWLSMLRTDLSAVLSIEEKVSRSAVTVLKSAPSDAGYRDAESEVRTHFERWSKQTQRFDELFLMNQQGQVSLSTDATQEGKAYQSEVFFKVGMMTEGYVNPPFYSPSLNQMVIMIVRPVADEQGNTWGVLAGRASLATLKLIMVERAGPSKTAETYLVGSNRAVLTGLLSAPDTQVERGDFYAQTEGVNAALRTQASGSGLYNNYRGIPVVGVYRWLPGFQSVLLAEQAQSEAFAPTYTTLAINGAIAIAAVLLSVVAAQLITRTIANPLAELARTAEQVTTGNLQLKAKVEREDEVGTLALAFNTMTAQLRGMIGELEQRVAQRTAEVERRANQVTTGAEISRATSQVLDPEELLRRAVSLIQERFDLYYVGIFVIDETGRKAMLRAGTGEAGRIMLERGHALEVGSNSMVGWACANRQARIALDVGEEAVRFANPLLSETRSEVALPLRLGERALGALDIQSVRPQAFDANDVTALQGMADQIAVAMENARLFQQTQAGLQEVERVNRLLTRKGWETFLRATPITFAESHRPGLAPLTREERGDQAAEGARPQAQPDGRTPALRGAEGPLWAGARVRIPLEVRGQVIGGLVVERAADQPDWSAADLDLLKALATQAAQTMDSARLFEESQQLAAHERVIGQVSAQMRETLDMDTVLQTAVRGISAALGLAALDLRLGSETESNGK